MTNDKFEHFISIMTVYDGFSDTNYPSIKLWSLELDEMRQEDFSFNCIFNSTSKAIFSIIETEDDLKLHIELMVAKYSDLNAEDYPEYTKGDFEFQSRLVGFAICHQFNNRFSSLPIVELSGPDAETIVTSLVLLS
ncbi:MAG: hypothetical protein M0R77_02270 [Gammaproteobacteria bacterium]|nr:hypothetical protein [Gammaproteobacteria bacterium]